MNELGMADLNIVAREAIASGNVQVLQSCLACSLSDKQLIHSVMETKRYELLPLLLAPLKSFFQSAGRDCANNLYLDLLLASQKDICEQIKVWSILDWPQLFIRAAQRDLDLVELDEELCMQYSLSYYFSIAQTDHLALFLKYKEFFLARMTKERFYIQLAREFAPKVLEYEALHGEEEIVLLSLLEEFYRLQPSHFARYKTLLRSICVQVECKELLTKAFSFVENKKLLQLLLELGARPSDKQKEALRVKNSGWYAKLFVEDV